MAPKAPPAPVMIKMEAADWIPSPTQPVISLELFSFIKKNEEKSPRKRALTGSPAKLISS